MNTPDTSMSAPKGLAEHFPFSHGIEIGRTGVIRKIAFHRIADLLSDAQGNAELVEALQEEALKLKIFSAEELDTIFSEAKERQKT